MKNMKKKTKKMIKLMKMIKMMNATTKIVERMKTATKISNDDIF